MKPLEERLRRVQPTSGRPPWGEGCKTAGGRRAPAYNRLWGIYMFTLHSRAILQGGSVLRSGSARAALLLALTAAPWGAAWADIYRCTGPEGKTLYSDAPCPRGAARSSNITTAVGACSTVECIAQREQTAALARERLRVEQEQVAELADRLRRDALERARLDELLWRQSVESAMAASAGEASYGPTYPVYYPLYAAYPIARPCGAWRCLAPRPRFHNGVLPKRASGGARAMHHR